MCVKGLSPSGACCCRHEMCLGTQHEQISQSHCYVWGSHGAGVREYTALLWPFHQSEWRNHRHCELTRLEARSTSVCCELVCVQRLINTSITHDIYEITVVIADLQPITRLTTVSSHFRNIIVGLYLAPWFLIYKDKECISYLRLHIRVCIMKIVYQVFS